MHTGCATILGSARGSRAGFGDLAETIRFGLERSWAKSSRSRGRNRQHVRPRALPKIAVAISPSEIPASNGPSNGSKINFFQPLHLCRQVEIFSDRRRSRIGNARKEIGILHRI